MCICSATRGSAAMRTIMSRSPTWRRFSWGWACARRMQLFVNERETTGTGASAGWDICPWRRTVTPWRCGPATAAKSGPLGRRSCVLTCAEHSTRPARSWFKAGTLDGANAPPYKAVKPADAAHGQQAYTTYCASCHGAAGASGKSKAGSITQPEFLALVSDQVLRTVVIAGRPDIGQPDWRNDLPGHPMSDQEVTDVVGWLSSQRPGAQQNKTAGGGQ